MSETDQKTHDIALRHRLLRPAAGAGQPLRRGDVGAVQLLRHAGHPAASTCTTPRRRGRPRHRRRASATGIVGAYGGAVYLSTILGAWLADRLLGSERTLFYSARSCVMVGHIALALLPGLLGRRRRPGADRARPRRGEGQRDLAWSARSTPSDDPRRDAGFSLFYLGINLGAFLGPLLTGLLQTTLGFHWGFGAGRGRHGARPRPVLRSAASGCPPRPATSPNPLPRRSRYGVAARRRRGASRSSRCSCWLGVITRRQPRRPSSSASRSSPPIALLRRDPARPARSRAIERRRVFAFIPLFIAQRRRSGRCTSSSSRCVTIYSDKRLDRDLFGWEMPVSWVQSINPVFIIVLSGVFAALWTRLGDRAAVDAGEVRARHRSSWAWRSCCSCRWPAAAANSTPLLGAGRHPARLHHRRAADLAGRAVASTTKLAPRGVPHPDGGAVLPVGRARHRDGRRLAEFYDPEAEAPYFIWIGLASVVTGVVVMLASKPIHRLMAGVD